MTILGNFASFFIWKKVWKTRGASSCIILFMVLALSDTLMNTVIFFTITVPYFIFYFTTGYNFYNHIIFAYLEKYVWPIGRMAHLTTVWITTLLTIHRYAALQFPFSLKTQKLTSLACTRWQIGGLIVFCVLYHVQTFFYFDIEVTSDGNKTYANLQFSNLSVNDIYNIASFSASVAVKGSAFLICIILTYKIIKLPVKAKAARATMATTAANNNKEREISVALVIVVSIFIICIFINW